LRLISALKLYDPDEDLSFNPDWRCPPGSTILELLQEKGITKEEFSKRMGRSLEWIENLLSGKQEIDENIAKRLSITIGGNISFWLEREKNYRK
jgi:plasmid maintenance system antidote protein VapI